MYILLNTTYSQNSKLTLKTVKNTRVIHYEADITHTLVPTYFERYMIWK